jgi:hypothetical protein
VSADERSSVRRLVNETHPPGSAAEVAAAYLRGAVDVPEVGANALALVEARLGQNGTGGRASAHLRWKTVFALVLVAVCVGGATGAAVWVAVGPSPQVGGAAPEISSPAAGDRPRARRARTIRPSRTPVEPARAEPPSAESKVAEAPADRPPVAETPRSDLRAAGQRRGGLAAGGGSRRIESQQPLAPLDTPAGSSLAANEAPAPSQRFTTPPPEVDPPPLVSPVARPHPQPGGEPASATPLARETELVRLALGRLRREHDPAGALALLDQHARRFPSGALGPEAAIVRVDALLALDRRSEALAILDRLPFPPSARGRELLVVHAELAAGAQRWTTAAAAFDLALADPALEAELAERALHGRAACRLRMGDRRAARVDLEAYLRRFPDGRFAATTRAALAAMDSGAE